ncbi:MAG: HlyC/CorC family transporter [Desulfobacteraceae bacterium]|nr:MAG: HlyC/CorC family transporter [Desulfobacteraceae bacterium]
MQEILIILTLLLSAFFAGAETVFLTASRIRLEGLVERGSRRARLARWFLERPARFVMTSLVGNNLVNIAFSSLMAAWLTRFGVPSGWILFWSVLLILVFGEVIPKSLARDLADRLILWVAVLLRIFRTLIFPVIYLARAATYFILARFGIAREEVREFFTRRDLEVLILEGLRTGALAPTCKPLLTRVFQLPELRARDVMTPRTEIKALEVSATPEDLRRLAMSTGFSKIPVYEGDLDHILGVVYARDLLDHPPDLASIIKPVTFFAEPKRAVDVFRDLRLSRQSVAVVLDEWGGTAGLVTLEDVIEELTGEIEDEYDRQPPRLRPLADGRWVVSGRIEVNDLNRRLGLAIPEGDYSTLGGYLIDRLERIPSTGEAIELEGVQFRIARASRNRVVTVVVKKPDAPPED